MIKYAQYLIIIHCIIIIPNQTVYSQWVKNQDFHGIINAAVLTDSNNIWGGGNIGQLFNYSISKNQFNYFNIGNAFDIFSVALVNDSIIALTGTSWDFGYRGFIARFNTNLKESIDTTFIKSQAWDLTFLCPDTGFVGGFGYILRTTDGGVSWDSIFDFPSYGYDIGTAYSITHDEQNNIYASGNIRIFTPSSTGGIVLKSANMGLSWKVLYDDKNFIKLKNIGVLDSDPQLIYCTDLENNIYTSQDGGEKWIQISIPLNNILLGISDLVYQSKDTVFAVVNQPVLLDPMPHTENMILRSTDGGNSWMIQFINHPPFPPNDRTLNAIILDAKSTYYCLGWNMFLSTNNDGGEGIYLNLDDFTSQSKKIKIHPNPTMDYIELTGIDIIETCTIYNSSGNIVKRVKSHLHKQLYVGDLLPGIYFMKIIDTNRKLTSQTFIKL